VAGEVHGSKSRVHIVGYDASGYFRSADSTDSFDTAEVSALVDMSKRYIVGLEDGTFSADGFYSYLAAGDDVRDLLIAAQSSPDALLCYYQAGDAIGNAGVGLGSIETARGVETPIADAVKVSLQLQSSHGFEEIVSLHPMISEAAISTGYASVDNGASSANGGVGYIHTPVKATTTTTVKIQHSVDNVTFVDLITFANPAANHDSQRIKVAGTVNRYTRAILTTLTGGPATFAVGFGRNPVN
jgi:hypothetical protein